MTNTANRLQRINPLDWRRVSIDGGFWGQRRETNRTATLLSQYQRHKKLGVHRAYQWRWPQDRNRPWQIWLGDLGKWIEAASYSLGTSPDAHLARLTATAVSHVLKGQKADGYLYANPVAPAQRWTNLISSHEHYDLGHMIEAAVAHFQATGQNRLLDAVCRAADQLHTNFGRARGKRRGYDGHEEIELALVKLYRATGRKRYLDLAQFFIEERGRKPYYFKLEAQAQGVGLSRDLMSHQAHLPVRQQTDAVGHAVRALYLYCGMADIAAETNDRSLLQVCRRLWQSVTQRRMYITGGVGSSPVGEKFTVDYDLPNEAAYAETCAAIGLILFSHRMLQIEADGKYADVMERALYNGFLSGISVDGTGYFYANHLASPSLGAAPVDARHCEIRQPWYSCACCPPNIGRLIAGLGQFIYSTGPDALYVHLFTGGRAEFDIRGREVVLTQKTDYPWKEKVRITVNPESPLRFTVALRIPGWCRAAKLKVNGKSIRSVDITKKGYARIKRIWQKGDTVELTLPMPVERVEAHPKVRMDCGRVALQRGPMVYCLEQTDNGTNLADIYLPAHAPLKAQYRPHLLGGAVTIRARGHQRSETEWKGKLYRSAGSQTRPVDLLAVPYCLWANRKPGEMLVWIRGS